MSYTSISTQLVAILDGIAELAEVYAYEPKELAKYPSATVTVAGHSDSFYDTASNRRRYQFTVRIYYRSADPAEAETSIKTLSDLVINAIESNLTLNGACDWAVPTTAKAFYAERELPVRGIEFTVEAVKRVAR